MHYKVVCFTCPKQYDSELADSGANREKFVRVLKSLGWEPLELLHDIRWVCRECIVSKGKILPLYK